MVDSIEVPEAIVINGITLLAVLNPPLQIPVSGELLKDREGKANCLLIAMLTAFIILIFFACLGTAVLRYIGISPASFSVAGGALLFIIGVQIMTSGKPSLGTGSAGCAVPIGTPFIAGPGAITVTTLMVQNDPWKVSIFPMVTIIAILSSLFITTIVLFISDKLLNILKEEGSNVLARIMGIVISAIGIEYIANGVFGLIKL